MTNPESLVGHSYLSDKEAPVKKRLNTKMERTDKMELTATELAAQAAGKVLVDIRGAEEWQSTGVIAGSHQLTFFDAAGHADPGYWLETLAKVAGPEDVEGVDLGNVGLADADIRVTGEVGEESLAAGGGEAFAVVDAVGDAGWVEDHGGGDDRARPGAAAGLVNAADRSGAFRFEGVGRSGAGGSGHAAFRWRPRQDSNLRPTA